MKRKHLLFLLLFALMAPWAAQAQTPTDVLIGDPESTTTYYTLPVNMYYNYSLTQQIFTACEIGTAGTINSIAFDYTNSSSFTMNNVQIYMMLTDKSSFETNTDMVALTNATKVWEGTFTASGTGWVTIELTTPFVLDGANNLLVCCYDPTYGYPGSAYKFRTTATAGNLAVTYYSDSYIPNPNDLTAFSGSKSTFAYRNNIQLNITPNPSITLCCPPDAITVPTESITAHEAVVNWEGGTAPYVLEYKKTSETEWTTAATDISGTTYTLSGLTQNTTYQTRVQSGCGGAWKTSANFTTAISVPTPTGLTCTGTTSNSATLSWTENGTATSWVVAYKTAAEENFTEVTVNTNPYTLSGLTAVTSYTAKVCAVGNGENSSYSSTTSFTTACDAYTAPYEYGFEDAAPFTCWTPFNTGTARYTSYAHSGSYSLRFSGTNSNLIALPQFTNATNTLALDFWTRPESATNSNCGTFDVGYMTDLEDANSFVAIETYSYDDWASATYEEKYVPLNAAPADAYIAFRHNAGATNWYWFVDDVSVIEIPACAKPTGLAYSEVTKNSAKLSWTSDADAWVVAYKTAADADFTEVPVTENPYTLTGLDPETAYTVKVKANCSGTYSDYSNPVTFTTAVACVVPTNFTTSNVGAHSVTLDWTSDASEWVVAYKTSAEEVFTEVTVTEKPYVLGGLNPETSYTVKVKAVCGGIDGESQYTTTRSFTTTVACPAPSNLTVSNLTATTATLTWTELGDGTAWYICLNGDEENLIETNETTYTFDGLESETVYTAKVKSDCSAEGVWSSTVSFEPTAKLVIGSGTATSGYLPTNTNYDFSFTQQIYTVEELGEAGMFMSIDFYMTGTTDYTRNLDVYMVSTEKNSFTSNADWIAVTAADMVFSGEVAFTAGAWTTITLSTPFVYDGTQNVAIIVDDNTDVWSSRSFRTFTAQATQAHYCYQDNTNIDPSSPSNSNNSTTTSKNQIRILKEALSNCMKPGNLTCTEFGPDFATLSWTEYGESTEWVVVYNGNNVTATTNEGFVLSGLDNETEYTIYVYPTCDETLASDPITVTTLAGCPAPMNVTVNPSYTTATLTWDGYNDSYNVYLGQATFLVNANFETGDFSQAAFTNDATYPWTVVANDHSGAYCAKSATGNHSQTSALQLEVELTSDLTLTFSAKVSSESGYDKAYFSIDDEVKINAISGAGNWIDYSYPLTAGTHTLRWYYTKDSSVSSNDDCFYVDDIQIVNGSTEIGTYTTTESSYDFTELTPGTTYQAKVLGICNRIESEWSEVVTFTTLNYPTFTKTIAAVGEENWLEGKGGYYLIASPLANALDPTTITGMTTGDYDLYSFDQEQDLEWQNYKAEAFNLVNGQGYLYANKEGVVLTFTGAPGNNGQVTLDLKGSGDWAGWNLVGNPFGEDAYINKPFYTLENSDTYTQNTVGTAIHAMQGLLVVADSDGETLTFSTEVPAGNKTAKLNMNLRKDDKQLDNAILVFGENQQLGKLSFRENSSKIYMPVEGKDYAIATAESNMGEMPVSFKAETNGSYTLSFNAEEVSFAYLHLIDNLTGIETDLLANPSYSFEASTTDYASRFKLVFATGNNSNDDSFAFFSNGSFVINNDGNATLQVVDVTGRIIKSESINGCANVNVNAAPGVYMLRLVNGENVKVQKVVVR